MDHFRTVMMSKYMVGLVCVCERGRVVHVLVERVTVLTVIIIIFYLLESHIAGKTSNISIHRENFALQTINTL